MINCTCVVQEGQAPDLQKGEIQDLLNRFTSASFGQEAQIAWIPVAPGNGFTERKPSTSSVVSMTSNEPLSAERRESLLRELAGSWTDLAGCSLDEIVVVIADPAQN